MLDTPSKQQIVELSKRFHHVMVPSFDMSLVPDFDKPIHIYDGNRFGQFALVTQPLGDDDSSLSVQRDALLGDAGVAQEIFFLYTALLLHETLTILVPLRFGADLQVGGLARVGNEIECVAFFDLEVISHVAGEQKATFLVYRMEVFIIEVVHFFNILII